MEIHKKIWPEYFEAVLSGKKKYELRLDDFEIKEGDTLVLFSDGLIDARPELEINNQMLADRLEEATSAEEMVGRLVELTVQQGPLPDDVTVLVARCTG